MAAIFQIRRGDTNISITDGELYLHKGSGSIQFGSGSNNPITLLPLNVPSYGDINLVGNISASGDVRVGGNIYLGNASADNISALGQFNTNLVPNGAIDVGTISAPWRNVYGTSISGAIAATNGVISGSSQIAASLPQGVVSGSSQIIGILGPLNSLTGSYATTGSNNFRGNQIVTGSLNIVDGEFSILTGSGQLTSSLTFTHNITAPNDGNAILELRHNNDLYNDDIAIKLKADFAGAYIDYEEDTVPYPILSVQSFANKNVYIHQDTRLLLSSLRIDENLTVTGSVIGLSGFTGSFSGSLPIQDGRLDNLEITSASVKTSIAELNSYTSSLKTAITASGADITINGNLTVKGTTTQIDSTTLNIGDNIIELNYGGSQTLSGIYTKDATGTLSSGSLLWNSTTDKWIAGVSGSESTILLAGGDSVISSSLQLTDLNVFSQSTNTRLGLLETSTGSLNTFTSSANTRLELLETSTGSLNTFSSSTLGRLDLIETSTGSLNTFTSSANGRLLSLETETGSLEGRFTTLAQVTGSIHQFTASLNSYTTSTEVRLDDLEYTASISIGAGLAAEFTKLNQFTASAQISIDNLESFTSSFSESVSASIAGLASASGYINYVTNSIEQLTGIEVADFDSNVAVTFINGTLKFIFGTPAIPTSIATSLSGFLVDRFNNVNDAYIVNGTWSNQGYTLVSASLYEGSTLLTEVGSGTSLSYNATTSGSHTYRLEYTASSPLDGTLYKTSTTATGTISKSNPASPTISPTVTVQLGASSNQIEQGATGSITFTSSSANPSLGWNLVNTTTNVSTPYFVTGSATGSTSISITATANYESPIGDNIPDLTTTSTATTTYTKIRSLRYGASTAESFTAGELENIGAWDTTLGGTIGTIVKGTTTASGQSVTISWTGDKYHYIVFNSSLSNLSNITTSGFGVLGQFSVTTVGQYKVYKINTLQAGGAGSSITYTLT